MNLTIYTTPNEVRAVIKVEDNGIVVWTDWFHESNTFIGNFDKWIEEHEPEVHEMNYFEFFRMVKS